jgi:hypothetical protein
MGQDIGTGKSMAALAAGAITTVVVTILTQVMHYQVAPELSGAIQTLFTLAAVWLMPHDATGKAG